MAEGDHQAKTEKRLAKLTRNGDEHIDNCGDPAIAISNVHHILPVTCMAKRFSNYKKDNPDVATYIERCLDITNWNINDSHNQIRLPKKKQYLATNGKTPSNLPCHDVDHPTYTDEVSDHLKTKVWDALCANQEPHKVDAKDIKAELEGISTLFKGRLATRGNRSPKTADGWTRRHDQDLADSWYRPFSMAEDPQPRSPGSTKDLSGILDKL